LDTTKSNENMDCFAVRVILWVLLIFLFSIPVLSLGYIVLLKTLNRVIVTGGV
jgi:hypothetical protein